jgi:hypothetical protein
VQSTSGFGVDVSRLPAIQSLSKNLDESDFQFPAKFRIAYYHHGRCVPESESTAYLARFNDSDGSLWKLLEGSGRTGVSHRGKCLAIEG